MASLNLNKAIIAGRLTADPELKSTGSGVPVISFRVAVNRKYKPKDGEEQTRADFLDVTAWRGTAEFVSKYFHKGNSICVVGSIQTRTWTDQNGQKRYATEIVADEVNFVDSKGENSNGGNYIPDAYQTQPAPNMEALDASDGLPF